LVRSLGLESDVSIEGRVGSAEVPSLIHETTVGVVSYERNPLTEIATPNKAYEYAVAGKPMVAADLGALRELLGDAALYYRPGDETDLAEKLRRILEDRGLRDRLSALVRERIWDHRWQVMHERLMEAYDRLLVGSRDPQRMAAPASSGREG
jgi:glycosyltransferase involved in cell wall biosynthesis